MDTYVKKGGVAENTVGRKCLCNALFATIGQPQVRKSGLPEEAPLITSGDALKNIRRFIGSDRAGYTAGEVIDYLLSGLKRMVPSRMPSMSQPAPRTQSTPAR